jgi:hypothetical protein
MEVSPMLDVVLIGTSVLTFERGKNVSEEILGKILLAESRAPWVGSIQLQAILIVDD